MQLRLNRKKALQLPSPCQHGVMLLLLSIFHPMSNMLSHIEKNQEMSTLRESICLFMYLSKNNSHFPYIFKVCDSMIYHR